MSARVREARHTTISRWASSGRILSMRFLATSVNIPAPTEAVSNWRAPSRSRKTSNTTRVKTENNTTKVIDPRAVTSTAVIVSHGVRFFATASRIALSMALTSPSINSLVIRTNAPNASVAPPNHRKRRPARADNRLRLTNSAPGITCESSGLYSLRICERSCGKKMVSAEGIEPSTY